MNQSASNLPAPSGGEFILYQTEDGRTRIQCRFENEAVWLTQKLMAELFQKVVRTINEHIQNVFAEGELSPESVIRKFRITAAVGKIYEAYLDAEMAKLDALVGEGGGGVGAVAGIPHRSHHRRRHRQD